MKVKLTGRTQVRGRIFKRDAILDITDEEYKARPSCFQRISEELQMDQPVVVTPVENERTMTKAQLMAKLDSLDIPYKARDTVEQLKARLEETIDNHPLNHTDD